MSRKTQVAVAKLDTLTAKKRDAVLGLTEYGTVSSACLKAGISRQTWYTWLEADPVFAQAVIDANEQVADELEKEAIRRAKEGSDTLIIFLLKCLRREKYQDRAKVEHTVSMADAEVRARLRWLVDELVQLGVPMDTIRQAYNTTLRPDSEIPAKYRQETA